MSAYTIPIEVAALMFMVLVSIIFIPWLIFHYRKYRYFSLWHTIVTFSFIFYSIAALFLVLLPLPQTRDTCSLQSPDTIHYILRPFNFIDGLKALPLNWSNPRSYIALIREQAFLEPFFNALILFPLGVYLRYFFQKRGYWWKATLIGFAVSLFFELTQLTGIYGLYNCPYRLFDVDDLFFNTLGSFIGYFLAPIILALFPSPTDVMEKSQKYAQRVTPMTQLLAILIDLIVIRVFSVLVLAMISRAAQFDFVIQTLAYAIAFILVPLLWKGQTVGSAFLRFSYRDLHGDRAKWHHYVKRFIAIFFVPFTMAIARAMTGLELDFESPYYVYSVLIEAAIVLMVFLIWFVLVIHGLYILLKGGKRPFYYDKVSNIKPFRMKKE